MNDHIPDLKQNDRFLPTYHFVAGSRMNDPQPFFWNGTYHLFFNHHEHPVNRKAGRGHAISCDLCYWQIMPKAFKPSMESDKNGCWTGSFFEKDGLFYTIYTGCISRQNPLIQTQNLAFSKDLISWEKYENNPINIQKPDNLNLGDCWRDPLVWQEGDEWLMIMGAEDSVDKVPVALLYKSKNLTDWQFEHIFLKDKDNAVGYIMECPDFFLMDETAFLISCDDVPPFNNTFYRIGKYENRRFLTEQQDFIDIGKFYAAKTLVDDEQRRILFGWISPSRTDEELVEAGWSGVLSLPRILSIENNEFRVKPVRELENLRKKKIEITDFKIEDNSPKFIENLRGDTLEIIINCKISENGILKIMLFCSEDCEHYLPIIIDRKNEYFNKNQYQHTSEQQIIHIFIDKSVVETFLNYKICYTDNHYSKSIEHNYVAIQAEAGEVAINSMVAWELSVD
jgi:beta-fructofuranosidase